MSDYGDASASEAELKSLFAKIQSQMNRIERVKDAEKKTQMLKAVQQQLLDAKQCVDRIAPLLHVSLRSQAQLLPGSSS